MSTIPPNWLGSIIQSGGAERRAAANRAAESAAGGERAHFAERLADVIESNDRDSQVYADAEGSGSQGRQSDSESQPAPATPPAPTCEPGLDIEA